MPAIEHITIRGFKSIASIEKLALRPLNVLIGANGSGKSNFIDVFELLRMLGEGNLSDYVQAAGGAAKLLHFGPKTTGSIYIRIWAELGCAFTLAPTDNDGLYESEPVRDIFDLVLGKRPFVAYHGHDTSRSSPLRRTARVNDNRYFRADGSNLAAILYYLRMKHEDSYQLIRETVHRVAPFFGDFQLEPLKLNPGDIKLEWRHKHSDQYFDASSLSDGTLRFIALATLFLQPEEDRPSVILVDEPELGLHPYAIEVLAALIRQASAKTQVIVSTQSPTLVDHFDPEDVLVAERVNGGTQLTRLDSARLAEWLKDYSLGQLWEKNEIGGRPVPE